MGREHRSTWRTRLALLAAVLVALPACRSSKSGPLRAAEPDRNLAAQAAARGDWRLAAERWWAVWQQSGGSEPQACAEAARAMLELGDAESASNLLDQGLAQHATHVDLLDLKARALLRLGYRRAAEDYLQRELAADPTRSRARLELGRVRVELGLERAALEPLTAYVAATGGDAESLALLARAQRGSGDPSAAYATWQRALAAGTPSVDDLLEAALLERDPALRALHPDLPAQCRAWLEQAVALDPQCTRAEFQLGLMDEDAGDLEAAVRHYRRAVETDPGCLLAITNLAVLQARRGNEDATRELVERALKLEKDEERRAALRRLLEPFEAPEERPGDGTPPQ